MHKHVHTCCLVAALAVASAFFELQRVSRVRTQQPEGFAPGRGRRSTATFALGEGESEVASENDGNKRRPAVVRIARGIVS